MVQTFLSGNTNNFKKIQQAISGFFFWNLFHWIYISVKFMINMQLIVQKYLMMYIYSKNINVYYLL